VWEENIMNTSIAVPAILALTALLFATAGAPAEIIKRDDMARGTMTNRPECMAKPMAVYVRVDDQEFCVRYYVSTVGGTGRRPVVFLQGDYFGSVDVSAWRWVDPANDKARGVINEPFEQDVNTDDLVKNADAFSKLAKTPAIYLARIGVDGSSGFHVHRKTQLELHLMNAALDAIKKRHGLEGFHLAGQSGGSMLVGGLVGLRRDVACAVAGAGPLGAKYQTSFTDPARSYFDVMEQIPAIAQDPVLRFMLVTDAKDQSVPVNLQTPFVEKMRLAGRRVPQFFVEAMDKHHHGVVEYTQLVTAGCVLGRSDHDIAAALGTIVKRNSDFTEARRKEGLG
jgi:hypothetical protein